MSRIGNTKYKSIDKSITGDAATDSALWRLSVILKEIAESAITSKPIVSGNTKSTSVKGDIKAPKSKKEEIVNDSITQCPESP